MSCNSDDTQAMNDFLTDFTDYLRRVITKEKERCELCNEWAVLMFEECEDCWEWEEIYSREGMFSA